MIDDPNQWWTLYGNVIISLTTFMALCYFILRGLSIEARYKPPLYAMAMVCAGAFLRIAPWAYAQLTSATCTDADERVICLYNPVIIEFRPWFTMAAALLILVGALKFRRWIDNKSIGNKVAWAGAICAAAFIFTAL